MGHLRLTHTDTERDTHMLQLAAFAYRAGCRLLLAVACCHVPSKLVIFMWHRIAMPLAVLLPLLPPPLPPTSLSLSISLLVLAAAAAAVAHSIISMS